MKVLIVEDEMIVAWNLKLTFERLGHEVIATATTAEEAIRQARSGKPNLVLMDIRLKGTATGIDAALEIRRFSEVPIAYLTGNEHLLSDELIRTTRPIGVFSKPITDRDLQEIIRISSEAGGA